MNTLRFNLTINYYFRGHLLLKLYFKIVILEVKTVTKLLLSQSLRKGDKTYKSMIFRFLNGLES